MFWLTVQEVPSDVFILRSLKVGNHVVQNVKASLWHLLKPRYYLGNRSCNNFTHGPLITHGMRLFSNKTCSVNLCAGSKMSAASSVDIGDRDAI